MCPRPGFRSGGKCERTLIPVFVPGEHPNVSGPAPGQQQQQQQKQLKYTSDATSDCSSVVALLSPTVEKGL